MFLVKMLHVVVSAWKCLYFLFRFLAERIYSEYVYFFGFGRSCKEEDSERGDVYVHQLIRKITVDRRSHFDPYCLNDCFIGFQTSLLSLINIKGTIEFSRNSIRGLKSLQQADSFLTINKDLMHISTCLKAGPIKFDSLVNVNFLGYEHRFLVKGTLKRVTILCDFTVNSDTGRNESLDRLSIHELKEIQFWVEEMVWFLKVPINSIISLMIFLKLFVRNGIECILESRIRKTLPKYKFPIEGNATGIDSSRKNELNVELLEDPPKCSQILHRYTCKYFSCWCDYRNPDWHSVSRFEPSAVKPQCPIQSKNPKLIGKASCSLGKSASNVVNQPEAKRNKSEKPTRIEPYFPEESVEELDATRNFTDAFRGESVVFPQSSPDSSEGHESMMGLWATDVKVESEHYDQISGNAGGISILDTISLCKRKLDHTYKNALNCTRTSKNYIDRPLAEINDCTIPENSMQVNSEGLVFPEIILQMDEIPQDTKVYIVEPSLQHKVVKYPEVTLKYSESETLQLAYYEHIKEKVKLFNENETRKYTEETLKDEEEYITICRPEDLVEEENVIQKCPIETEEKNYTICEHDVTTGEDAKVKLPVEEDSERDTLTIENRTLNEESAMRKMPLEGSELGTVGYKHKGSNQNEEKLLIEANVKNMCTTSVTKVKTAEVQEKVPFEDETEYLSVTDKPEVSTEEVEEKRAPYDRTEYTAATSESEVGPGESILKLLQADVEYIAADWESKASTEGVEETITFHVETEDAISTNIHLLVTGDKNFQEKPFLFEAGSKSTTVACLVEEGENNVTSPGGAKVNALVAAHVNEFAPNFKEYVEAIGEQKLADENNCFNETNPQTEHLAATDESEDVQEAENMVATCVAEVETEDAQEILPLRAESKNVTTGYEREVTTEKKAAEETFRFDLEPKCVISTYDHRIETEDEVVQEKLPSVSGPKYVSSARSQNESGKNNLQVLFAEAELKKQTFSIPKGATLEEPEKLLYFETEYATTTSELEVGTGESTLEVKVECVPATGEAEFATEETQDTLPLEAPRTSFSGTCRQITKGENYTEILPIKSESKNIAVTCRDEVAPQNTKEKLLETESEYVTVSCEVAEVVTDKETSSFEVGVEHESATCEPEVGTGEGSRILLPSDVKVEYVAAEETREILSHEVSTEEAGAQKLPLEAQVIYVASICVDDVAEETLEILPFEAKLSENVAVGCEHELSNEEGGIQEKFTFDAEREYVFSTCKHDTVIEDKLLLEADSKYVASAFEIEKGDIEQEILPIEAAVGYAVATYAATTKEVNAKFLEVDSECVSTCKFANIDKGTKEKLLIDSDSRYVAAACRQVERMENDQEISDIENAAAACIAEVANKKSKEKLSHEKTEYLGATCEPEGVTRDEDVKEKLLLEAQVENAACEPKVAMGENVSQEKLPLEIQINYTLSSSVSEDVEEQLLLEDKVENAACAPKVGTEEKVSELKFPFDIQINYTLSANDR